VHEIKYDGYHRHARIDGRDIKLLTRTGLDWSHRYRRTIEALANSEISLYRRRAQRTARRMRRCSSASPSFNRAMRSWMSITTWTAAAERPRAASGSPFKLARVH
jgi:hypothetical protein